MPERTSPPAPMAIASMPPAHLPLVRRRWFCACCVAGLGVGMGMATGAITPAVAQTVQSLRWPGALEPEGQGSPVPPEVPPGEVSPAPSTQADSAAEAQIYDLAMPGLATTARSFWQADRWVWLRRAATGEEFKGVYWRSGRLQQQAYEQLCWILRDVQMQKSLDALWGRGRPIPRDLYALMGMSVTLLDILYALSAWLDVHKVSRPITVNSGFRHPRTNAALEGAARNSLHQLGRAADLVIPGIHPAAVSRFGAWLQGGGVGIYTARGFIHLDDGRIRTWGR